MNKKLQISKLFIVTILLVACSGIYITDFLCLCNLKHSKLIASEQNHPFSVKKLHGENTGGEHNNKDSKSDRCCSNGCDCAKESTYFFIADLNLLITPTSESKLINFDTPFLILNIPKHEYKTPQFITYQYNLLPQKIPDIRVLIQSFIL